MRNKLRMYPALVFLLVFSVIAVISCSPDAVNNETPSVNTSPAATEPTGGATVSGPRWAWSAVDGTPPSEIVDRDTGELIKDVNPEEAFAIIISSEYPGNPVILDVRTPEEYAEGHLRDAVNID